MKKLKVGADKTQKVAQGFLSRIRKKLGD